MKKLSHEHYSFTSATPGLAFDGNMVVYAVKEGLLFPARQKLGSTKWENGDHDEFVRNLTVGTVQPCDVVDPIMIVN